MSPLLTISALAMGITLLYASLLDIRERRVPFRTWYPMLAVCIPVAILVYAELFLMDPGLTLRLLFVGAVFSAAFYLFAYLRFFGGADAWALIFITLLLPLFPVRPLFGYPPFPFLPFSVLVNALILNLAAPLAILAMNIARGNRAPFPYMLLGFPVPAGRLGEYWGFVMEEIAEKDGIVVRNFVPVLESLRRMYKGEDRMYTRDLRMHPERYERELELIRRAGDVWISYGVPFIVPITAGLCTAILAGDLLYALMVTARGF